MAPFRNQRRNSRTLGSKSFSLLIFEKMGSQLCNGYMVRHFSNPLLITKALESPSGNCFFSPAGTRNLPLVSRVTSYSPRKPIIYNELSRTDTYLHKLTQFPTFNKKFGFFNFSTT